MTRSRADQSSLGALARYFLALGATGFGGPAALADRMRADLVESRRWLSRDEFDLGLTIAASCPGPLAYQLAVYCGFIRHGVAGALAVAVAFAAVPFILVVTAAAAYGSWSVNPIARGLFYGAAPAVTVLIARAAWNLGRKTLHRARLAWLICLSAAALTALTGREPLWLFVTAGVFGVTFLRPTPSAPPKRNEGPGPGSAPAAAAFISLGSLWPFAQSLGLFGFFFQTGCLVFGSGMVIVPVLRSALVDERGWVTARQFLDAVTVGLVSPGPVVITATFVGYLVDRIPGAVAATVGMFLPAVLVTIVATPWFIRHRRNPALAGFVRGMTAAVVGVLAGAVPLVARSALPDAGAVAILVAAVLITLRWRVADPLLVAAGAAAGVVVSRL